MGSNIMKESDRKDPKIYAFNILTKQYKDDEFLSFTENLTAIFQVFFTKMIKLSIQCNLLQEPNQSVFHALIF